MLQDLQVIKLVKHINVLNVDIYGRKNFTYRYILDYQMKLDIQMIDTGCIY